MCTEKRRWRRGDAGRLGAADFLELSPGACNSRSEERFSDSIRLKQSPFLEIRAKVSESEGNPPKETTAWRQRENKFYC